MSGFIDTYYSYNFSRPDDHRKVYPWTFIRDGGADWLDVRAFDRRTQALFTLDNVEKSVFKPSTEKDPIGLAFDKLR